MECQQYHSRSPTARLRFIGIDNSTNAILPEQLAFFERTCAEAEAAVLMIHIPLYTPEMMASGHSEQQPLSTGALMCDPHTDPPPSATTAAFLEAVRAATNLVAIFAGHSSRRRDCHPAATPSRFSRRFDRD